MIKTILTLIFFFSFAVNSYAIPYSGVGTIDHNPDRNVHFIQTANYSFGIADNGFTIGEEARFSYNLGPKQYDNSDNKIMDNITLINKSGAIAYNTTPLLFELTNQNQGMSLDGVTQLKNTREFGVTVSSKWGDFIRDYPDVTSLGNVAKPVPETGKMVLLGFGLMGLAIYSKRRMNKEG